MNLVLSFPHGITSEAAHILLDTWEPDQFLDIVGVGSREKVFVRPTDEFNDVIDTLKEYDIPSEAALEVPFDRSQNLLGVWTDSKYVEDLLLIVNNMESMDIEDIQKISSRVYRISVSIKHLVIICPEAFSQALVESFNSYKS